VRLVERVVEKIVIGHDPQCLNKLEQARQLLAEASDRLMQSSTDSALPPIPWSNGDSRQFPTLAEVERAMINAAYKRSNRKPLEAARLLGIGKTTFYRKLREMRQAA
jgi:transcriptional regulator of acetoin/glycerol metabolism